MRDFSLLILGSPATPVSTPVLGGLSCESSAARAVQQQPRAPPSGNNPAVKVQNIRLKPSDLSSSLRSDRRQIRVPCDDRHHWCQRGSTTPPSRLAHITALLETGTPFSWVTQVSIMCAGRRDNAEV
ncbi:hypothetical protein CMUS01_04652 [Colletotrichum musicola]|uniref:Uncharacterized protein n=1 Tax=Colletotrichum musicola TaxID=2175873 RepID=A0A8H6NLW4_9PEZI|nr:hypothetical protein CMUS01_04652 [Colletotrichum musicola]